MNDETIDDKPGLQEQNRYDSSSNDDNPKLTKIKRIQRQLIEEQQQRSTPKQKHVQQQQ